ncbi:hypothetical protein K461DRAFT_91658 [Myriangium duriaei CBS 260.36]|uniref:Uncharacterized protein n=1 Tax=Myriangium duriaei CBS 260.36 TaxID=1168546 RepID=A0A9P4J8R9_9PEZI|nr:hypothetical protein K461DRAFT_91658 [Myriangium duriaei CBS 260.36]
MPLMIPLNSHEPDPPNGKAMGMRRLVWDPDSAMAFRELAGEEELLLLTPAATTAGSRCQPPPPLEHPDEVGDPFQALGEAIGEYHARVRHVPYLYWIGMTDVIYKWLDRVPTVVVVICEPSNRSQEDAQRILHGQLQFLQDALSAYNQINEGTEPAAISVLYFGTGHFNPPEGVALCLQFPPYDMVKLSVVARELLQRFG